MAAGKSIRRGSAWFGWTKRWLVGAALTSAIALAPPSSHAALDPVTLKALLEATTKILPISVDLLSGLNERDRIKQIARLAHEIGRLREATTDLERLIRSEAVRDFYVASVSLNGRVSALGEEYQSRAARLDPNDRAELVGRLGGLRDEAQRLAFAANPIRQTSGDDGFQFLLALRSIMVSVGLLQSVERDLGSFSQTGAVYTSSRAELSSVTDALDDNLATEERIVREGADASSALIADLAQDDLVRPLAEALRQGQTEAAHCVESRDSTFDRRTPEDVCIGSIDQPVKIGPRINRETGETVSGRRVYGCVRYVRESRTYRLEPVYRFGALIGGRLDRASSGITYHSTSDSVACPIQREMFESEKDWAEIETAWRRSLDRVYAYGSDVALAEARKALIHAIKNVNVVLSN